MSTKKGEVALSTKLYYGFGSVAYGVKDNGFSYFLLAFYSQVLGLDARLVSMALFLALIVDAISDPIIGHVSDNLHSRFGRRHPLMYASVIPVVISYFFLWHPPEGIGGTQLFWYLFVLAVLVRTFITMYEIPATSLAPELTGDYDQRTSLFTYRYFFGWMGGLGLSVVMWGVFLQPNETYPVGFLNRDGWSAYGFTACVMIFLGIMVSSLGTHRHIPSLHQPPERHSFSLKKVYDDVRETLSNKSFQALFVAALFFAVAAGVSTNLNTYINRFFWQLQETQIALLTLANFASAIIAWTVTPKLAARGDKKKLAIRAWLVAGVFLPMPVFLRIIGFFPESGPALFWLLVGHSIIEVTIIIMASILVSSMTADIVEESERTTERRSEGLFFAARNFASKSVNGLGIIIAGQMLAIVNFPTQTAPADIDRGVLNNLGMLYIPTILVFYMTAIFCLRFYKITREGHGENLQALGRNLETPVYSKED